MIYRLTDELDQRTGNLEDKKKNAGARPAGFEPHDPWVHSGL
jgi:hypothetical protein